MRTDTANIPDRGTSNGLRTCASDGVKRSGTKCAGTGTGEISHHPSRYEIFLAWLTFLAFALWAKLTMRKQKR